MVSQITSGVKVRVTHCFLNKCSSPKDRQFLFAYAISITNNNNFSIQLLTRHWTICDSLYPKQYVNGEGVVGEKPILLPGETYNYQSYCDLKSSMGWMDGSYIFRKELSDELIEVTIPKFELVVPNRLN